MTTPRADWPARGTVLTTALATLLLAGCALIKPPPVPSVPRMGLRSFGDAPCASSVSRAHTALAATGAAAGDPAATAAAHAAYATAISEYHTCLANRNSP